MPAVGEARAASPAMPPKRGRRRQSSKLGKGRLRLRVALALALLLLVLGLAGAKSVALLQHALRTPAADDIAQRICTIYQSQDYNDLLDQIDPTPLPPVQSDPFDASVRRTLLNQLASLDANSGKVRGCSYKSLDFDTSDQPQVAQRQYLFTMERTVTFTTLMTLVRRPDGSWKVSRDSNFLGGPASSN